MEQSVIMGPVDVERLSSQEWAGNWPGPCMRSAAAARAIIVRILGQWTKRCPQNSLVSTKQLFKCSCS